MKRALLPLRRILLIRLLAFEVLACPFTVHAACPPNSVQVGEQDQREGNVIIIHPVCQWLAAPRRYVFNDVPALPRLAPEISDSSVRTALARARAFLLQKARDAAFKVIGDGDMALSVMYNVTKLPGVIFPKVSEAAAMNADPDATNASEVNAFGDRITVKSVRTLFDVGGGQGNELADDEHPGSTLFSAFFPKTAAKTAQAAQTAPTWMPDIKHIIGIWAPAETQQDAQ